MWNFGDRIPAGQLAAITEVYEPGAPFEGVSLPLYHHAGTYDEAVKQLGLLFKTLGINNELAGGNFVICLGPNKGINAFRA